MAGVVLGRHLLAAPPAKAEKPPQQQQKEKDGEDAVGEADALLRRIQLDDRFFCDTMELIPAQFYFPTDEEENWRKSGPKPNKKYHRDILAQKQQASSKKGIKRAKFNPSEQKTNEERQLEAAQEEKKEKQAKQLQTKQPTAPLQPAKDPSSVSIDGLKERLAAKLAAMREQRKADDASGKKRKANANAKGAAAEPASKKRKGAAATNGAAFNNKVAGNKNKLDATATAATGADANGSAAHANGSANADVDVSASSISYGSLLLAEEKKEVKKTRNGQAVRGIKNLLKKAERNQQRMEELKKTEEGKALVESKQWDKALKQAAGEVVLDDPKLLRKKLKKKEKTKAKSAKDWKKRTAAVEMQKKEKQKKRLENLQNKGKTDTKGGDKKDKPAAPRAGFEGKKGENFLNADKAKKK